MEHTKYTFWQVLQQENKIEIPIIQRDYAQGRKTDQANTIRKDILDSLFKAINEDKEPLDFDFVYGTLHDASFVPLDGQQRLTTLFLLHWYLAVRDGKLEEAKGLLRKFTYETRFSSRDFCEALVEYGIVLPDQENNISSVIEDQHWFFLSWEKDPTIQSMLVMLDGVHKKFKDTNGFFGKLTDPDKYLVSFQFIKIDKFGLTDSLYIKMNARGKQLTEFENFKAKFEQFLEKNYPKEKQEFAQKVDGKWTDFFWLYRQDNLIDIPFIRFFQFISELLYYQKFGYNPEKITDLYKMRMDVIEEIYNSSVNLDFLFKTLDLLSEIKDMPAFFESVFSQSGYQPRKVALFDNNVNLFDKCIKGSGFDVKEKILFYFMLLYMMQNEKTTPDEDLIDRVRIVRNLILRVRQRKHTEISSDLRYSNLSNRIENLKILLDTRKSVYDLLNTGVKMSLFSEYLSSEAEKARLIIQKPEIKIIIHSLEDHPHFRGAIHNLDITQNISDLGSFNSSIYDIWSLADDSFIIRAMLTIGDYSINIGYSALGNRFFFGNDQRWYSVLSVTGKDNADKVKQILPLFLKKYVQAQGVNTKEKLQYVIDQFLGGDTPKDWSYYFVKYPDMLSNNNLFTPLDNFELRNLNKNTLLGYHINPYVRTVVQRINDESIIKLGECYSQYEEKSPLILRKRRITMHSVNDGWKIGLPENVILTDALISTYNLTKIPENGDYLLKENETHDKIEVAEKFVTDFDKVPH